MSRRCSRISAAAAWTRAVKLQPDNAALAREVAQLLLGSGFLEEALTLYRGMAQSAGATTVADGTAQAAERLGAVLNNDPGIGVLRHADAGYETAIETAARAGLGL